MFGQALRSHFRALFRNDTFFQQIREFIFVNNGFEGDVGADLFPFEPPPGPFIILKNNNFPKNDINPSISFGEVIVAIDGNLHRVLSRLYAHKKDMGRPYHHCRARMAQRSLLRVRK